MKISEFILLDELSMKAMVLHQGVLIAKRRKQDHLVFLFQMDGYYVEAYFDMRNKSAIEYHAFNNINALTPYLDTIAIDDLFV